MGREGGAVMMVSLPLRAGTPEGLGLPTGLNTTKRLCDAQAPTARRKGLQRRPCRPELDLGLPACRTVRMAACLARQCVFCRGSRAEASPRAARARTGAPAVGLPPSDISASAVPPHSPLQCCNKDRGGASAEMRVSGPPCLSQTR